MSEPPAPATLHEALVGNTGFLISRVGLAAQRAFADRIAEVGLTPRGWGALNVLDKEGAITQQSLGKCIGMDPSTMVQTIDELEAGGLVERRRNPRDRRAHALHVTPEGRRALVEGRRVARRAQEELLRPLNGEERRALHDLLLRLANVEAVSKASAHAREGASQATTAISPERTGRG